MRDINPVPSAEGVKPLFGIRAEFQFIIHVYFESLRAGTGTGTGAIPAAYEVIDRIMLLRIIGDEPIHNPKRNIGRSIDDGKHQVHIRAAVFIIKSQDFMKQEVVLGVIEA